MTAQTATDVANMINGADLRATVRRSSGSTFQGILVRNPVESLDISGRDAQLMASAADAGDTTIGDALSIDGISYVVREIENGHQSARLRLERQ